MKLDQYSGYIFDMDGTLYRGHHAIPGAAEVINRLQKAGKKIVYASNKTTGSIQEYHDQLSAMGIQSEEDQIINATIVAREYLSSRFKGKKFYAIGEQIFIDEIQDAGLIYEEDPEKVNITLITLDRTFTYEKLEIASHCLDSGARFFAANIDNTCPVEDGEIWDAGSTIAALEKRTHRKLELHFGKPSTFMITKLLSYLQLPPMEIVLVGDRVETDIAMANHSGIDSVLVLSGVNNFYDDGLKAVPTYTMNSIKELLPFI